MTAAFPIFAYYEVKFDPFAVHFPEGWFLEGIRWYGLAYLAGFLIGLWLLNFYYKKNRSPLNPDETSSLLTYMIFGIIIGARLGYMLFYDFDHFAREPMSVFYITKGGMASHGGFIGVAIALALFSKIHKVEFFKLSDLIALVATPGIFLGRIANFVNGELWGKVSNVPWAMRFPASDPTQPVSQIAPRHPSQLYEAFAEGLLIFVILQIRFFKSKPPTGQITGEFFILYAIARIVCEIFREPDVGVSLIKIGSLELSRGTFYSLFCLVLGIIFVAIAQARAKKRELK
ncbi:MAG: prolipoprotein diacylglyceryl transferase [Opitutales bacterium]|nr:prolipoprotein diacylglyceryl transferase [Opitutales bacterium]